MKDFNYPIFYTDGTCVHCSKKSVVAINKMGRIDNSDSPIYPLHFMKCNNCGREYFIRWDDDKEEFSKPIPVSFNYIDEFTDLLKNTLEQNK